MKVLLTGSIGVGKTTLFDAIPEQPNVAKIPEVARRILSEAPETRLKPDFQRILLTEQYRLESEAEGSGKKLIICDRGYFDVIAYSKVLGIKLDEGLKGLIRMFTPYDLIFYCDPRGTPPLPVGIDGVVPGKDEKRMVDESIRKTLSEMRIPWRSLVGPTVKRLGVFYNEIESVGGIKISNENEGGYTERR